MDYVSSVIQKILTPSTYNNCFTGTQLSNACCETIRLKFFKIGAVVLGNTRRVRLMLSTVYPHQALFTTVAAQLTPP